MLFLMFLLLVSAVSYALSVPYPQDDVTKKKSSMENTAYGTYYRKRPLSESLGLEAS